MNYENILVSTENSILTITINRPDKLNALNQKTLKEIKLVFEQVYDDKKVRGIIITGAGDKAFVAGADIVEFKDFSKEQGKKMAEAGHAVFNLIENCKKPVIAAVNGFALGGGCELAMACHMRVASSNAKFGQPEVNLGIIPGYGGTQRLVQLVGKGKALELLTTGDMIGAEEAKQLGLVNHVTSKEELMGKCVEILEKTKSKSPLAVNGVIRAVNAYFEEGTDGFKEEIDVFRKCFGTADFSEGTAAFIEKRKPNF